MSGFYLYDHYRDSGLLPENLYLSIVVKLGLTTLFPLLLLAMNFYDAGERRRIAQFIGLIGERFSTPTSGRRPAEVDAGSMSPGPRVNED